MPKNKKNRDVVPPRFKSLEEAGEFWDTHSLADYWDQTREVKVEVDLKRQECLTALEPDLFQKLGARAHQQGIATETLINIWLNERLAAGR